MGIDIFVCSQVTLECDFCENWNIERTGDISLTQAAILKRLRSEGWSIGKVVKCPNCSGKLGK